MVFCRNGEKEAGNSPRSAARLTGHTPIWLFSLLFWLAFSGIAQAYIIINAPMTDTNATGWNLGGNPASAYLTGTGGTSPTYDPAGQGWLRLTNTAQSQTGYAYNTTSFDLSAGVLIQFDYASWGGSTPGADGTSVFLFDSNVSPFNIGAFGGSLGYAQKMANNPICSGGISVTPSVPGVSGGYVGIGLDEYGNYAACTEGRYQGWNANSSTLDGNTVTIRGPVAGFGGGAVGSTLGASSYPWVYTSGSTTGNGGLFTTGGASRPSQTGTGYRKVMIQITPAPNPQISVWIQFGYNTIPVQVVSSQALPAISASQTLMVGFGASTGSLDDFHDIRNLLITTLGESTSIDLGITKTAVAQGTSTQLGTLPVGAPFQYVLTAANFGPNDIFASGVGVTDAFPSTITAGTWSCSVVTPGTTDLGTTACPTPATGTISGNTLSSSANLSQGGSVAFTVNASVPTAPAGNSVSNTASLTIPGAITDFNPNNNSATSTLSAYYAPLAITKSFVPATVTSAATATTLTLTISNPTAVSAAGIAVTDTYPTVPTGLTNASTSATHIGGTCKSTYGATVTAATGSLAVSGITLPAGGSCTVTENDVVGAAAGNTYTNTIPAGALATTTANVPTNAVAASATFTVMAAATLPKPTQAFAPAQIGINGTSNLTMTFGNPNGAAITGVGFTDTMTAGAVITGTPTTTCGNATITPSNNVLTISGLSIPPGGCTITAAVTSATAATYTSPNSFTVTSGNDGSTTMVAATTLTVLKLPTVSKSFAASSILSGGTTTTTVTLTNPNAIALTGAAFTDTFPAGLLTSGAAATTCAGGTATASNNGTANGILQLSAATIPVSGSCTITVSATSSTPGSYTNTIPVGGVTTTNAGANALAASSGTLTVMAPPTVSKSFAPNSIPVGSPSVLTITLSNPNPIAVTGAQFTDTYPTGTGWAMTNSASPSGLSGCGGTLTAGAGGAFVQLTGGTIPANGSCNVTVNVTINSASGTYTNTIPAAGLTTTNSGANTLAATANLNGPQPPTVTKSFSPSSIMAGSASTLTIGIASSNGFNLTNAAFTDSYPAGMVNLSTPAPTNSCGGTLTAAAGTGSLSLSGGTIPSAGCSITVPVTGTTSGGSLTNTMSTVTTTQAPASNAASGSLFVILPPIVAKSFFPNSVVVNVPSTLTITLSNPPTNSAAITGVNFTDSYPTNGGSGTLVNSSTTAAFDASSSPGCSGIITGTSGSGSLALTGGSIPVGGSCVIKINATSSTAGTYNNSTGAVTSTNSGTGPAASASLTTTLQTAPTVSKAFSPASMPTGGSSTLTINLTNPSSNALAISGVNFIDSYPTNGGSGTLVNSSTGAFTSGSISAGCTGTVTGTSGSGSLALSGGTIPANTTCSIAVNVTSTSAGTYNNSTGSVTSANAVTSTGASASLGVLAQPTVTDSFNPSPVPITTASTLTIAITNPNSTDITGASFTDSYTLFSGVGSLVNSSVPNAQFINQTTLASCSGTVTATAGASSLSLSLGVIPANTTCTLTVSVNSTGNTNNAVGTYQNSVTVASANAPNSLTKTAQLVTTVLASPTIAKSFNPTSVPADGNPHTSTLTITLTNPTANTVAITGVTGGGGAGLIDTFPSGMTTAASATLANSCGGIGALASGSISLTGGTIGANSSCTLSTTVQVTTSTSGQQYQNTTTYVTTSDATPSIATSNTAILTAAPLTAPSVTKSFAQTQIGLNVATTMTISLTNPSANTGAITGVNFTDSYPTNGGSGTLANNSTGAFTGASISAGCSGTITGTAGSSSLALTGGTIPVNTTCTITVNVASATAGTYVNNITVNTANAGSVSKSATLTVLQPLSSVTKSFSQNILPGGQSILTVTLANLNNGIAVTGAGFTDTYPANLFNTAALNAATTCTGATATATNGATGTLTLSGATIPGGGSCTVTVTVTSASVGNYTNTINTVTTTNAGTVSGGSGSFSVLLAAPTAAKSFATNPAPVNGSSTLAITLSNTSGTAITGVSFTDPFPTTPGSLVVAATPGFSNSCGGTVTTAGGGSILPGVNSLYLTGGTIPANGNCTVQVNVVTATAGSYTNTTSQVTSGNAFTAGSASAPLTVYNLPSLLVVKSASKSTGNPGDLITYSIAVTNTGTGTTGSNSVILTDFTSPYLSWGVNSLKFTDGSPASGLTLGTPQYSNNGGTTWGYAPVGAFDANVTNWKAPMNGTMNGGGANFTLTYTGQIK